MQPSNHRDPRSDPFCLDSRIFSRDTTFDTPSTFYASTVWTLTFSPSVHASASFLSNPAIHHHVASARPTIPCRDERQAQIPTSSAPAIYR